MIIRQSDIDTWDLPMVPCELTQPTNLKKIIKDLEDEGRYNLIARIYCHCAPPEATNQFLTALVEMFEDDLPWRTTRGDSAIDWLGTNDRARNWSDNWHQGPWIKLFQRHYRDMPRYADDPAQIAWYLGAMAYCVVNSAWDASIHRFVVIEARRIAMDESLTRPYFGGPT